MSDEDIYLTIPDGGDYLTIVAGQTVIDLYEGTITDPSGNSTSLRQNLRVQGKRLAESLFLYTDKAVKLSLNGQGYFTVESDQHIRIAEFPFRELYLVATEATCVKILVTTCSKMLVTVVTGDRGGAMNQGLVSIAATPTLISAATPSRKSLIIYNNIAGATIYVGGSTVSTVGALQGMPVGVGGSIELTNCTAAIYAISAGAATVNYLEER